MAKLILSLDDFVLNEIALTKERTTIGRRPNNDIQIDNLAVSADHAVIVMATDDWLVEDLGSTNGTLVNGKPVKKQILQDNDVIELGRYKLKFVGKAAPAALATRDYDRTMVVPPATLNAASEQAPATSAAGPVPPSAHHASVPPPAAQAAALLSATPVPAAQMPADLEDAVRNPSEISGKRISVIVLVLLGIVIVASFVYIIQL